CGDVDLRGWEVGESAGVVHVEMCDDDVPDVISLQTHLFDLAGDRLLVAQDSSDYVLGRSHPRRVGAIICAEAAVDQDQPVVGLDKQHVADHRGGRHVHGAAVEVMNLHAGCPSPPVVT